MITGVVHASREAVIRLPMIGTQGQRVEYDVVLDTGFTGFLTLPLAEIASLGYSFAGFHQVEFGDGRVEQVEVYTGIVEWDGIQRIIEVEASDIQPLAGMSLIYGYELLMQAIDGGIVTLRRM